MQKTQTERPNIIARKDSQTCYYNYNIVKHEIEVPDDVADDENALVPVEQFDELPTEEVGVNDGGEVEETTIPTEDTPSDASQEPTDGADEETSVDDGEEPSEAQEKTSEPSEPSDEIADEEVEWMEGDGEEPEPEPTPPPPPNYYHTFDQVEFPYASAKRDKKTLSKLITDAVLRQKIDINEEFQLINDYNAVMHGIIEDHGEVQAYFDWLDFKFAAQRMVSDDLDTWLAE